MNWLSGTFLAYVSGAFIALSFFALGLKQIIKAKQSKRIAQQSQSWPVTQGIITEARIKTESDDDTGTFYAPIVRYSYEVDGLLYEGQRIAFGSKIELRQREKAAEYLALYPVDREVRVYYNPEKHSEAALQQVAHGTIESLVMGIIILVISSGVFLYLLFLTIMFITG